MRKVDEARTGDVGTEIVGQLSNDHVGNFDGRRELVDEGAIEGGIGDEDRLETKANVAVQFVMGFLLLPLGHFVHLGDNPLDCSAGNVKVGDQHLLRRPCHNV